MPVSPSHSVSAGIKCANGNACAGGNAVDLSYAVAVVTLSQEEGHGEERAGRAQGSSLAAGPQGRLLQCVSQEEPEQERAQSPLLPFFPFAATDLEPHLRLNVMICRNGVMFP